MCMYLYLSYLQSIICLPQALKKELDEQKGDKGWTARESVYGVDSLG